MLIPLTPVVKVSGILVSIEQTIFYSRGNGKKSSAEGGIRTHTEDNLRGILSHWCLLLRQTSPPSE